MKRKYIWKRTAAVLAMTAVLMTDQSVIYGAGAVQPEAQDAQSQEGIRTSGQEQNAEEATTDLPAEEALEDLPEESAEEKPVEEKEPEEMQQPETKQQTPLEPEPKEADQEDPEPKAEEEQESGVELQNPEQEKETEPGEEEQADQPEVLQDEPEVETPKEDRAELPDKGQVSDQEVLEKEIVWEPFFGEQAWDAETFLLEQERIGVAREEEAYEYEEAYGRQLLGTQAGVLYEELLSCLEGVQKAEAVVLGEFFEDSEEVLDAEADFASRYEPMARNAFDAFWYDCAKAEVLEDCSLKVRYEGTRKEDGGILWTVLAGWDLTMPEEEVLQEVQEDNRTEEDTDWYTGLESIFVQVSEIREKELEDFLEAGEEIPSDSDERYARMFQQLCRQTKTECVLVKGLVGETASMWNAVRQEEGDWYLVDIPRSMFLKGAGEEQEASAEERVVYGDFSNSHQGLFVSPVISETDYQPEEKEPAAEEPKIQEETLGTEQLPEAGKTETIKEPTKESEPETPLETQKAPEVPESELLAEAEKVQTKSQQAAVTESKAAPAEKVLTQVSVTSVKPQTYTGRSLTPKLTVKDASTGKKLKIGSQYTVSYENNVNAGTATAVIRGVAGSGYDGVLRVNFTIKPQNIKKVKTKVIGKGFAFTGQPVTPGVTAVYNKMSLSAGTDYQIQYVNNDRQGNAQIHLTGTGNYTGTKVLKFKISANMMKDASISLSSYSGVYGGKEGLPEITVTYGSMVLRENVDYAVVYPKKMKVGKNYITIKGRGNFKGSAKVAYTISKASLGDAEIYFPYAWQYTGKNLKVMPTSVTVGGVTLQAKKDYTIKFQNAAGKKSSKIKEAGNYQIILTGKGLFQGTVSFPFCVTSDPGVLGENYNSAQSTIKPEPPAKPDTPADTSPDETVTVDHDQYFGYYEGYKIYSKKGIQGVSNYTEDTRAQHVLLNVDLSDLISTSERPGYIPYTYNGKTYYFGDLIALKNTVYHLHGWGGAENPYGANHNRNVTFVLLMGWKDELSYLIHPSARKRGAAPYYALNMQEAGARQTFEALFRYMGEEFGAYKTRVSNWTLGNEVNSCKEWNYSGGMSLKECVSNYAQAFQLLSKGVKRAAKSSRLFLSLDHCWTASVAGHSGKSYLDQFAAYMSQTAPGVQWNVNFHPYSQPLSRTSFWKDNSNTTQSAGTKYISMKNIKVLTDYLSGLESTYGKAGGSIRVIIGELGYTAKPGNAAAQREQAAAVGYGYYIAMFNTRIDSYIIRAYLDDPAETKSGLYLGLRSSGHEKKAAYDVFQNLDTPQSLSYMQDALSVIGIESWESVIPGFRADELPAADF